MPRSGVCLRAFASRTACFPLTLPVAAWRCLPRANPTRPAQSSLTVEEGEAALLRLVDAAGAVVKTGSPEGSTPTRVGTT